MVYSKLSFLLAKIPVCAPEHAAVDGDQPRVRPFGTINLFEGQLYLQTGKVKDASKLIHPSPKIGICAFSEGKRLRAACKAIDSDSVEARKHMPDNYPGVHGMYDENDGNCEVFRLRQRQDPAALLKRRKQSGGNNL